MFEGPGEAPGEKSESDLPKPKAEGPVGEVAGGLPAEGVAGMGGVPELNSAHRGHLRLVSGEGYNR